MTENVLVVEDDEALREALCDTLTMAGYAAVGAADGAAALRLLERGGVNLVVSDIQMRPMDGLTLLRKLKSTHSGLPLILMTAFATVQQAVEAMREGAVDYLVKPFEAQVLVSKVSRHMPGEIQEPDKLVAVDPCSRSLLALARRVAESDATVMISGDSGSGKEVLARYIHRHSRRAGAPFVAINCAAIPDNMLEAVLFGYEKGAFTGAYKSSSGKFELAQGGTLMLDEISEMDLGLQAKLLRVLQEREVERLGGHELIPLDIRVLATSNRDMRRLVAEERFREDLFYRLNVFPLKLPALRERPQDILPLAESFIARGATAQGRGPAALTADARDKLRRHVWPGNVRELDNVIQRALILRSGENITADDIQLEQAAVDAGVDVDVDSVAVEGAFESDGSALGEDLKVRERDLIIAALREGNGSRKRAAQRLGISPRTLRYKLQRLREAGLGIPGASG